MPIDGQRALDNSVPFGDRRIGWSEGEIVVLSPTNIMEDGLPIFHGHVENLKELKKRPGIKKALKELNLDFDKLKG